MDSDNNAVSFYDTLAPMFDVMTDWESRLSVEGPFLRAMLEEVGARRLLDAACGSGGHALALSRWGYPVAGADISRGMIALAQKKASAEGLDVPFYVAALHELPDQLKEEKFDAVLCLGNSLPHLLTQDELVAALRGMRGVLRSGGLLVLQNLNYDLRWRKQPRWFAAQGGELDGQEVLVWRFADYDQTAGRINFHIALFRKDGDNWQVDVQTTPHRPLFLVDLRAALDVLDFRSLAAYGKMALPLTRFDADASGDLVIVARMA